MDFLHNLSLWGLFSRSFLNTQIDIHKTTYKHFAIIILSRGPYHQNEQGFFSYLSLVKAPYLENELELIARSAMITS
jgi:hypothetical protein